jgi:hypothetical protein
VVLSYLPVGDNPQQPGIAAETYIPDQLIAGNMKLVTDTVTVGGSVILPRGSLLGLSSLGSVSSSAGKTFASGTIAVAALPTAGDTLTIAGTVITFVTANPSGNQVMIGGPGPDGDPPSAPTVAGTALALIDFLVGSADSNLVKCTYSLGGTTITATAAAIGTGGNALTLATSDTGAFTLSGATLSGGTANTGAETIGSISAGTRMQAGNYTVTLTSTTQANVTAPNGVLVGQATVGTAFSDAQINFTITTGASIAAGDQFVLAAALGSGSYVLATATATDGSQTPTAILADYSDPTAGAVQAPVYLMGEFNTNAMNFGAGISVTAAKAALRPLGIHLKTSIPATDPS